MSNRVKRKVGQTGTTRGVDNNTPVRFRDMDAAITELDNDLQGQIDSNDADILVLQNNSTASVLITSNYNLPASATQGEGILRLANRSGSSYTITADGSDTIEDEASQVIHDGETFDLILIGTNWVV